MCGLMVTFKCCPGARMMPSSEPGGTMIWVSGSVLLSVVCSSEPLLDQGGAAVQDFCYMGSSSKVLPWCAACGTGESTSPACVVLSLVCPALVDMTAT